MFASDYRREARIALAGKWGSMALIYFLMQLLIGACSSLLFLAVVAAVIVGGVFTVGYHYAALKTARGVDPDAGDLFSYFKNMAPCIILYLVNGIFIFLWGLLLIIPGIIKTYSYSMSYFVLVDNPQMTASEARAESVMIMRGNKWRLFCLDLSFIGWYLLTLLTLGILSFWVEPYRTTARAKFYESIREPLLMDAINESRSDSEQNGGAEWQPKDDGNSTKGSSDFFN